ncbi:MAG: glycosyltransferase [Verrucomicrobiota bacterium]
MGPYHHARLNAAGKVAEVFAIEACALDNTYAWEKLEGAVHFTRITLQERDPAGRREKREFRDRMFRALDKLNPEVVAIPGWSFVDSLSALSWCVSRRKPVVVMSDSTSSDSPRAFWKEAIKRQVVKLCSSAFVAGTPHTEYISALGMPPGRIFLGYDAVDNEYFSKGAEEVRSPRKAAEQQRGEQSSVVRGQYGLPENYFLASARFVEKKNLPRLIEAYARYRKMVDNGLQDNKTTGPSVVSSPVVSSPSPVVGGPVVSGRPSAPWSLVLLGDGPLKSDLCHLISDLGLQHSVLLPGFKQYPDLPAYYGLASAFIHASTTEQWGLVVNEAMASGLPVLVSNRCGCAQDLVREGVNGFTFDPYNVEEMANVMLRLTETPKHRLTEMGDASRQLISAWGPERFARGLHDAAETALKNPPPIATVYDRLLLMALIYK